MPDRVVLDGQRAVPARVRHLEPIALEDLLADGATANPIRLHRLHPGIGFVNRTRGTCSRYGGIGTTLLDSRQPGRRAPAWTRPGCSVAPMSSPRQPPYRASHEKRRQN